MPPRAPQSPQSREAGGGSLDGTNREYDGPSLAASPAPLPWRCCALRHTRTVQSISRPPQFAHQPQKIDLTPGLGDLVTGYTVNDEAGEFDDATSTRNAFELALMCRPSSRTKHNTIVLGDQVVDGVVRIGKCGAKLPLNPLEFGSVHRGAADVTDVVGGNELIEAAGKAAVCERNPATDEFLVSLSVFDCHRLYSSERRGDDQSNHGLLCAE